MVNTLATCTVDMAICEIISSFECTSFYFHFFINSVRVVKNLFIEQKDQSYALSSNINLIQIRLEMCQVISMQNVSYGVFVFVENIYQSD